VRIVHISTYDWEGGASRSAYRLHEGLRRLRQESRMFVARKTSRDPLVVRYDPPGDLLSRILRTLRRVNIVLAARLYRLKAPLGLSFFSDDRTKYGKDPWRYLPGSDLIQLHWVTRFVDYRSFFELVPATTPIVWTLHDMVPFTGGCHYDQGCHRFAQACGRCPQLGSESNMDLTRQVWLRKCESFQRLRSDRLHVVTPSRWLGEQVEQSALLSRFPRSVIPYGVDTETFTPRDRRRSREMLGIPLEARVILFLAEGVRDPRKGLHLVTRALENIESPSGMFLLSLGSGAPVEFRGFPSAHINHVCDDSFLSQVYSAADILVAPSLQDNLPNTVLESISCGTPVVGFAVGGIPDMVRPGLTGVLAAPGDATDLRRAIIELLSDEEGRKKMAIHCRKIATQEYSLEIQARRYVDLYEEILGERRVDGLQQSSRAAERGTGAICSTHMMDLQL
jgi:glycosyltransferase involved in cell wall biosynthesis